jgi:hypothetical protein
LPWLKVSVTFRTDITESNWGTTGSGNGFGSGRSGAAQQWDRAHIDLTKGAFHLRAGQYLQLYGMNDAIDSQDNGLSMDYKVGPGTFNVFFMVDNDNAAAAVPAYTFSPTTGLAVGPNPAATAAEAANDQADAFVSGAKFSGKADNLGYDLFVGNYNDGADQDVYVFGVGAKINLEAITLKGELDYFTGDASKTVDAVGTQLLLDASLKASDAATVGGQFFYAQGDDKDKQYTHIGNGFNGWDPINDNGNDLSNEAMSYGSPFDLSVNSAVTAVDAKRTAGLGAGVVGGRLYAGFKASDDLKLGASAGYFVSEEDKIADIEVATINAGLVYNLMENTTLQLQVQYADGTYEYTAPGAAVSTFDEDFDYFQAGTGLFVKF